MIQTCVNTEAVKSRTAAKEILLIFPTLLTASFVYCQPVDTWEQKCDFGWYAANGPTGRDGAVGFSIDNKGYIGTGNDGAYTFQLIESIFTRFKVSIFG